MKTLYAAYGSNMNLEQMAARCPGAEVAGHGFIDDYRLVFRVVADIDPFLGGRVPVVYWWLSEEHVAALDRYEGFPRVYARWRVPALVGGRRRSALVYLMQPGRRQSLPSRSYYKSIEDGYRSAGLDQAPLLDALRRAELKIN